MPGANGLSFDDALGRSAAVSELRRIAQPQGLNLAEALAALDADALPGLPATSPFTQSLLTPYREAQRLLAKRSGNDQPTIVTSPAAAANRARESSSSSKADTALSLANLTETRENDAAATPTSPAPAVAIAAPEDLFGHTFDVVIFGGFVNGFIPSRDMCDPGVIVGGAVSARKRPTGTPLRWPSSAPPDGFSSPASKAAIWKPPSACVFISPASACATASAPATSSPAATCRN